MHQGEEGDGNGDGESKALLRLTERASVGIASCSWPGLTNHYGRQPVSHLPSNTLHFSSTAIILLIDYTQTNLTWCLQSSGTLHPSLVR